MRIGFNSDRSNGVGDKPVQLRAATGVDHPTLPPRLVDGMIYNLQFVERERAVSAKTVAFDLDNTLTCFNDEQKAFVLRPEADWILQQLIDKGHRNVLWTTAKRDYTVDFFVQFPLMIGLFDRVITTENYYPDTSAKCDEFLAAYQHLKGDASIAEEFLRKGNVIKDVRLLGYSALVDDSEPKGVSPLGKINFCKAKYFSWYDPDLWEDPKQFLQRILESAAR